MMRQPIDDASTDNTLELVSRLTAEDRRIHIYNHHINKGTAEARNLGTAKATGELIAFLDSDDLWHKDKLKLQVNELDSVDVCFGSYEIIDEIGRPLNIKVEAIPSLDYIKLLKANYIGNLTGIYNVSKLGKIYTKNIRKRQDWLLWLEALKRSNKPAKGLKDTLAFYRIKKNSLSSNKLHLIKYNFDVYKKGLEFGFMKSMIFLIRFFIEHFFVKKRLVKSIS
ncbi:glycosyltransferase family 2 protein [uncultured Winogradskyella sp.]|uniref:glycosyltransferase family 2 protein n=1 Tax=uncultured Winogradskyella sp. TaxID=395353 RepID=UPI003511FC94